MRLGSNLLISCLTCALTAGCGGELSEDDIDEIDSIVEGKADIAASLVGPLRFTEAMVNPRSGHQWVELINTGTMPIDLTKMRFSNRMLTKKTLRAIAGHPTVVPPGAMALIVDNVSVVARMPAWMPAVSTASGKLGGSRLAGTDALRLYEGTTKLVEQSTFTAMPAPDVSLERPQPKSMDWVPSPLGQTPGMRNAASTVDAVHVVFANPPYIAQDVVRQELLKFIGLAKKTLDIAVYQANDGAVWDALIAAKARKVAVRVVTDTEYYVHADYRPGYDRLAAAGIPVVQDLRTALMHSKFIIVDGELVWTGSYNFLVERNPPKADNAIWYRSKEMAVAFTGQFEQLFAKKFGPNKVASTQTEFYVDGARVEALFSPKDPTESRIDQVLKGARQGISFATFSFYSNQMSTTMIERDRAGVVVRGVFDARSSGGTTTEWGPLTTAKIDVRVPGYSVFLHDKFLIIDENGEDPIVLTGSYNFSTKAAYANDESLILMHDPVTARLFGETFRQIYLHSSGPNVDANAPTVKIQRVMASTSNDAAQFVEVSNSGTTAVDLTKVSISDGEMRAGLVVFPTSKAGTMLGANQRAWIVNADWTGTATGAPAMIVTTQSGQIGDGLEPGDNLLLQKSTGGFVIDSFSYSLPTTFNHAIARTAPLDLVTSWKVE